MNLSNNQEKRTASSDFLLERVKQDIDPIDIALPRSALAPVNGMRPSGMRGIAATAALRLLRTGHQTHKKGKPIMSLSAPSIPAAEPPAFESIKAKQQSAWASGDYSVVGSTLQIVGETLCEALDVRAGQSFLDVAAGNGNVSLAAARRYCSVTSSDYVPQLLDRAAARASADGLAMRFKEADAENLPFDDGAFDIVASSFGVMFAPDHQKAAAELARVCRPGGKIGLASWTPDSFIGRLFKVIGKYAPPAAGLKSPALWGTPDYLHSLFGGRAAAISANERDFVLRYHSAEDWLNIWRAIYGPLQKAFDGLGQADQAGLGSDLVSLINDMNDAKDGTMVVRSQYLEAVITRA